MAALLSTSSPVRSRLLFALAFVFLLLILRLPAPYVHKYIRPDARPDPTQSQSQSQDESQDESDAVLSEARPQPRPSVDRSKPRNRITDQMREWLRWDPPVQVTKHYPPYDQYETRDFDPNRWEAFEQKVEFYLNGTLDQLEDAEPIPSSYSPYPAYNSNGWHGQWQGHFVSCDGPRGLPLNESSDDLVTAYQGVPVGFPSPDVGSFEAIGLDGDVCFDRYSRLGPYGLDSEYEEDESKRVDFAGVQWGKLQYDCLARNRDRYSNNQTPKLRTGLATPAPPGPAEERPEEDGDRSPNVREEPVVKAERRQTQVAKAKSRSAVLIRAWDNYEYRENDKQALRSLVTELSLRSGGEYQVFLFVNVKDESIPIFDEPEAYDEVLNHAVPEEFRDMTILWNEQVGREWYRNVGEAGVYWQQYMPVQWFSETHPEFEYVWNWEMDVRYIGQHYHFLEKIAEFSKAQPRKFLWERNSRFYFPDAHGSWDEFFSTTNSYAQQSPYVNTVWGPQKWHSSQVALGPVPPCEEAEDDFEWGVDEEADFITLLPMWDPTNTVWSYRDKLFNYPQSNESTEARPYPHVPRRTYINTLVRLSKTLLHTMHLENNYGMGMASEMWPSSIALQHGLKAVYAPHPIWLSQKWPAEYMDFVFNADGWGAGSLRGGGSVDTGHGGSWSKEREEAGQPQSGTGPNGEGLLGRWSAEWDNVYAPDREHNFGGWSWYFWSDFSKIIYWRWLGWHAGFTRAHDDGQIETTDELGIVGGPAWEERHGRLCLPGMLLHPVKNVVEPDGEPDLEWRDNTNTSNQASENEEIQEVEVSHLPPR